MTLLLLRGPSCGAWWESLEPRIPLADQKYNPSVYSEADGLTCHYLGKAREHPRHSRCAKFLSFHV